jgi:plastocyanin
MNAKTIGAIVVVILVAAGGWYLYSLRGVNKGAEIPSGNTQTANTGTSINPQSQNVTVTYTDQGFSPQKVTVPQGATVTFVNQSSRSMWVASAPHPAHTGYDGTSRTEHCATGYTGAAPFDECANGTPDTSWSFTFDKVGTWPFHNHSSSKDFGSVTVTAPVEGGTVNVTL